MGVVLVACTALDLDTYLRVTRQATGKALAANADRINVSPPLHHVMCLEALKKGSADRLFHAAFIIGADERDMPEIIETLSMPHAITETLVRGVQCAYVAGLMTEWRDALSRGCSTAVTPTTRDTFNQIYKEFERRGLTNMLQGVKISYRDGTFLLEHR